MTKRQAERLARQVTRMGGAEMNATVELDGLGDSWLVRLFDARTRVWTRCSNGECSARDLIHIHCSKSVDLAIWHGVSP